MNVSAHMGVTRTSAHLPDAVAAQLAALWSRRGSDDPYPIYRRLRDHAGLFEAEPGHWIATRHAEVKAVLGSRSALVHAPELDPVHPERPGELDLSFLSRNPPDHGRLRRLATPAFRPALLRGYRDRIAVAVAGLLADLSHAQPFDLVAVLATPVPVGVICALLGVEGADIAVMARYGQVVGAALSGMMLSAAQVAELEAVKGELAALFTRLASERAADPRDDVISQLAASEDQLTPYELIVTARLLLIAGFETTVNLIGSATHALLSDPDTWTALVADPDGVAPGAVNESLRHDPPVQGTGRYLDADLDVCGTVVPAGSWVSTLIGSANRDETVFPDPDAYDPGRANADDHLAFSGGIHYCLGAPLARLEGEVALAELARRAPELQLAPGARWRESTVIRGYAALPVRQP